MKIAALFVTRTQRPTSYVWIISLAVAAAVFLCAVTALAQEGVTYPREIAYTITGEAAVFSHKKHVEDFGLVCDDCHGKIFAVKAFAARAKGDFSMNAIYAGKYCGVCHNGQKAFASDDYEQCARCHAGRSDGQLTESDQSGLKGPQEPIQLGSGDNVAVFMHKVHSSLSCDSCHTAIFPMKKTATITSMDDINSQKSCGSCHNGKTAFDAAECGKCHPKM